MIPAACGCGSKKVYNDFFFMVELVKTVDESYSTHGQTSLQIFVSHFDADLVTEQ